MSSPTNRVVPSFQQKNNGTHVLLCVGKSAFKTVSVDDVTCILYLFVVQWQHVFFPKNVLLNLDNDSGTKAQIKSNFRSWPSWHTCLNSFRKSFMNPMFLFPSTQHQPPRQCQQSVRKINSPWWPRGFEGWIHHQTRSSREKHLNMSHKLQSQISWETYDNFYSWNTSISKVVKNILCTCGRWSSPSRLSEVSDSLPSWNMFDYMFLNPETWKNGIPRNLYNTQIISCLSNIFVGFPATHRQPTLRSTWSIFPQASSGVFDPPAASNRKPSRSLAECGEVYTLKGGFGHHSLVAQTRLTVCYSHTPVILNEYQTFYVSLYLIQYYAILL